jgi:hypothetical protein
MHLVQMQHNSMLPAHWMLHRTHREDFDLVLANKQEPWHSSSEIQAAVNRHAKIEQSWRAAKCQAPSVSLNVEAWFWYVYCRVTPWAFALDWDLFARHHLSPTSTPAHDARGIEALQWMAALLPGPNAWHMFAQMSALPWQQVTSQLSAANERLRGLVLSASTTAPSLPVFQAASLRALLERAVRTFFPQWWTVALDQTILSWWQELPPGYATRLDVKLDWLVSV